MKAPVVTVFGSSQPAPLCPEYQTALDLGRAIAEAGWTLCNGGYGGTMEASARGAVEAGGHTIGVTCSILNWRGNANRYIRQEVPTFDLHTRLNTLVRLAGAYVVLPGGTGTMLELALVWELFNKRMLKRNAPIVLLGEHWTPLREPIMAATPDALDPRVAADVDDAIRIIREARNSDADAEATDSSPGD